MKSAFLDRYFGSFVLSASLCPSRVRLNIKQIWVKNRKLKVKTQGYPSSFFLYQFVTPLPLWVWLYSFLSSSFSTAQVWVVYVTWSSVFFWIPNASVSCDFIWLTHWHLFIAALELTNIVTLTTVPPLATHPYAWCLHPANWSCSK